MTDLQVHYPFENRREFEDCFPADFIAEGIDQTRGWFYTLLVLSTALFGKPPFKNLIVNGLVLASDGQKMSKRKKNYPDPLEMVKKYGADSLRLYLTNRYELFRQPDKYSNEKKNSNVVTFKTLNSLEVHPVARRNATTNRHKQIMIKSKYKRHRY